MLRTLFAFLLVVATALPTAAQSQAINGTIAGTVKDESGGTLPGVTITITNVDTGVVRSAVTGVEGTYSVGLLPLGTYQVRIELAGFKTVERTGVTISAGRTAVVNADLSVGGVQEVVQVSADAPVTQPASIDLGRTISQEEIVNLPNVARNSYNFALLQPNVTGYANEEFGATRMNANGSQMRTNYQIDGASATQKDRAGLRMFQPSEVMVQEVKVTTSGFAPEF
ncbi:MAG: carboxypeptidase-like regulatory domain-containing protein, partial [Acidobacteriota bacterium]|nr:carboxypeptidase-like regulatory domain-containing protein [Acidobacteriota bacterium]